MLAKKFNTDFPYVKECDWELDSVIYEVYFEIGKTDYVAYYENKTNLLMYTIDIRASQLPDIVKNAVKKQYPNSKIDDANKIVKGTQTLYGGRKRRR